jgi:hypothetical protein
VTFAAEFSEPNINPRDDGKDFGRRRHPRSTPT